MPRYGSTSINQEITDENKKIEFYRTTLYKDVPELDTDMYFITTEGDRCDGLAQQFYGDPHLWWFIAKINGLTTMNIPAGTSLRIPISSKLAKGL